MCKALLRDYDLNQNKVYSLFAKKTVPFPVVKIVLLVGVKKRSLSIVQLYVKIKSHQDIFGLVIKMS